MGSHAASKREEGEGKENIRQGGYMGTPVTCACACACACACVTASGRGEERVSGCGSGHVCVHACGTPEWVQVSGGMMTNTAMSGDKSRRRR
jgi:hypothetical protein